MFDPDTNPRVPASSLYELAEEIAALVGAGPVTREAETNTEEKP